jgi:AcrR family transcriptional regulator
MSVEERRAAIVEAALPLLMEQGAAVRTSDIAEAAGIAEGTVFRAFHDKKALLQACVHAVFESSTEVRDIEAIDPALPLVERLTIAGHAVAEYQNRLWTVVMAVRATGVDPRDEFKHDDDGEHDGPPGAMFRIAAAIAGLFDEDRDELRVEPQLAARLLLGLLFSNRMQPEELGSVAEVPDLIHLFLHGALRDNTGGRNSDE